MKALDMLHQKCVKHMKFQFTMEGQYMMRYVKYICN